MRYIFLTILCTLYINTSSAQLLSAADVPTPDTLHGIALVLAAGGTMTYDSTTKQLQMVSDPEGIVIPVKCICVRIPIELVPPDLRGKSVGYVTHFYRKDGAGEIPANDVLMFKIRD